MKKNQFNDVCVDHVLIVPLEKNFDYDFCDYHFNFFDDIREY